MLGPYTAQPGGRIAYLGNKIFSGIDDVLRQPINLVDIEGRVQGLHDNPMWGAISRINDTINFSVTNYFRGKGALFAPLPMTTRMISSPGAVYGKEAIDYTTDTSPITLNWFDLPNKAFLAESSQIYLELMLLQRGVDHVFANYHSFRKEESDATHLSEFHHIEYEGHVTQQENMVVLEGMLRSIVRDLLINSYADLEMFLTKDEIIEMSRMFDRRIPQIPLVNALQMLYQATSDEKYREFTLQHFGSWEEIKLTELIGGIVAVTDMPLLEVPFYHAMKDGSDPRVADCADVIWPGYRETVGSGHRVRSIAELKEKARIFNLPQEDYEPYLQSRKFEDYEESSGFGMGWERLLQGLLKMPFIYSVSHFPRVHLTLKP